MATLTQRLGDNGTAESLVPSTASLTAVIAGLAHGDSVGGEWADAVSGGHWSVTFDNTVEPGYHVAILQTRHGSDTRCRLRAADSLEHPAIVAGYLQSFGASI